MPFQRLAVQRSRVLVVAPHMDDEVIACGGTLLLHRNQGSSIKVAFVSDNTCGVADPAVAAEIQKVRRAEMERVRAALGFESVDEYGFPDGSLMRHESAVADRLAADIRAFQPDQILCPFPVDGHADHQACALATSAAAQKTHWKGNILAYEVWSTLWPNAAVDISTVADEKETLVRLYASQMDDRDYASATLALNRYRGLQHKLKYAEAFHACSPAEFGRLTDCLNEI
jgi:LmbE family N-acetylglucosaminyl deacetylase